MMKIDEANDLLAWADERMQAFRDQCMEKGLTFMGSVSVPVGDDSALSIVYGGDFWPMRTAASAMLETAEKAIDGTLPTEAL